MCIRDRYKTVRINHLGDWGTQFGKMAVAYEMWGDPQLVEQKGIRGLLELYVRFHDEAKEEPSLDDKAREYSVSYTHLDVYKRQMPLSMIVLIRLLWTILYRSNR